MLLGRKRLKEREFIHPSISVQWTHLLSSRSRSKKHLHFTTHKLRWPLIVVFAMSANKEQKRYMVLSAIAVTLITSEVAMLALQIAAFGSLFSAAFIGLLYGELVLLNKIQGWGHVNAEGQISIWPSSIRSRKTRSSKSLWIFDLSWCTLCQVGWSKIQRQTKLESRKMRGLHPSFFVLS